MVKTIKTNIKFYKGLGDSDDRLYGFVTKVDGSWRGCRESEPKKKIVFLDKDIRCEIIPNKLYRCTLIPMKSDEGFIVKHARLVKFRATISSRSRNGEFEVRVRFGNCVMIYDPESRDPKKRDIQTVAESLRNRVELDRPYEVAEAFVNSAFLVKRLYEQSKQNV